MSGLAGALVFIAGVGVLFYVFTVPGDQIALAAIGGATSGLGVAMLASDL